jgi:hypothetical protein
VDSFLTGGREREREREREIKKMCSNFENPTRERTQKRKAKLEKQKGRNKGMILSNSIKERNPKKKAHKRSK